MPYNSAAVEWSDKHFDHVYQARWWPRSIPVLVLAGAAFSDLAGSLDSKVDR